MRRLFITIYFAGLTSLLFSINNDSDSICTYLKYNENIEGTINRNLDSERYKRIGYINIFNTNENLLGKPFFNRISSHLKADDFSSKHKVTLEAGYLAELGDYRLNQIKINYIHSYQVNPNFWLGIGSGWRFYHVLNDSFIPLFADIRINFNGQKIIPYFALEAGCSIDINQRFGVDYISPLINPSVGISFKTLGKSLISIGIGYEKQKKKFVYNKWEYDYESIKNHGAISIIVGYSF